MYSVEPGVGEDRPSQPLMVLSGLAGGWGDVAELLEQARSVRRRRRGRPPAARHLPHHAGSGSCTGPRSPGTRGLPGTVGAGFAGRVAATRRPVILADVQPGSVLNPALHRAGIKSLLGVPVSGPAGLLGVVHVGSATPRVFTEHDTAQLEKLADQLAVQVLRRRASEEHIAALALQRSLLPTAPRVDGLDVAARYVPADGDLGGDWYDVFACPASASAS